MSAGRFRRLWAPRRYGIVSGALNLLSLLSYLGARAIDAADIPRNCRWLARLETPIMVCWLGSMFFAFCIGWIGVGQDDRKAVTALSIAASVALFAVIFLPPLFASAAESGLAGGAFLLGLLLHAEPSMFL